MLEMISLRYFAFSMPFLMEKICRNFCGNGKILGNPVQILRNPEVPRKKNSIFGGCSLRNNFLVNCMDYGND